MATLFAWLPVNPILFPKLGETSDRMLSTTALCTLFVL